jgi:hypothetical protein
LGLRQDSITSGSTFACVLFALGFLHGLDDSLTWFTCLAVIAYIAGKWLARRLALARARDQRRLSEAKRLIDDNVDGKSG